MKTEGLDRVLQLELECAKTFVTLLKREQQALIDGDIETLTSLNTEKIAVVNQLMQLHEQRSQLQTAWGVSTDSIELDAQLVLTPVSTIGIAQQCQILLQSAKQLNHTNQNILAQWLRQTRQSLQALRNAVGQAELYNPKGMTT